MVKHIVYVGSLKGFYVAVEAYDGTEYAAFFWKFTDAQNWDPRSN